MGEPPVRTFSSRGDLTYVWARLKGGMFVPPGTGAKSAAAKGRFGRSALSKQTRGAPGAGRRADWGWAPGYYSTEGEKEDGEEEVEAKYQLTLLAYDNFKGSEHTLTETSTKKLLESGNIVLANSWAGQDFIGRLAAADGERASRATGGPPPDLIELVHLHEPSVVHALRFRAAGAGTDDLTGVYTDTGPILLAVNPFKRDGGRLYGDETLRRYRAEGEERWIREMGDDEDAGGDEGEALPPHVYRVADRTYRSMMARLHPPAADDDPALEASEGDDGDGPKTNQSVLVSGESGAGKTWTTKLLMAYLSKMSAEPSNGGDDAPPAGEMSLEQRILQSNPIVESFGNARTVRNDNSSRFGKYIEMKFASRPGRPGEVPPATLYGTSIETYLLEKVRLTHQSPGERNYHIFYELLSMKDEGDEEGLEKIGLQGYDIDDFKLINASGTKDRRDGVLDTDTFRDLKHALSAMGFGPEDVQSVFGVASALLHASNLTFEENAGGGHAFEDANPHLRHVVDLLGVDSNEMNVALCYQEITSGGRKSTYRKVLTKEQCETGVESLIKATYGALFDYLVRRVNASIAGDGGGDRRRSTVARRKSGLKREASVGILDIFGFESFKINSFEQLCINYCNESLQQQFNRFMLKNEQDEYAREGIPWTLIAFPDNQDVLDLIDAKGTGILHVLQDTSRTPKASDKSFAQAMYKRCTGHKRFKADPGMQARQLFAVDHYAGLVEYDIEGFMEKTKDELPKSAADLLMLSTNEFVQTLAEIMRPPEKKVDVKASGPFNLKARRGLDTKASVGRRGGSARRPTVGIQFSSQLHSLRRKIDNTSPHYVRCLKPNDELVPDRFDAALIADQLRCAGIIEALRMSRQGFPLWFTKRQFVSRYRILIHGMDWKSNSAKTLLDSINQGLGDDPKVVIEIGKAKVFMRREAYDLLEKMRGERISSAVVTLQRDARMWVCRNLYRRTMAATKIQKEARMWACRIFYIRTMAAIKMQKEARMWACRMFYTRTLAAINIQKEVRKWSHQRAFTRAVQRAVTVQRCVRKMISRLRGRRAMIIQCAWRSHEARRMLASAKVLALWWQARHRGRVGRRRYDELNREQKSLCLQSRWRGYVAQKRFKKYIRAVLIIQCAWRSFIAQKRLKNNIRAVLIIQCAWRGFAARALLKGKMDDRERRSASRLQSNWRCFTARRRFMKHIHAVLIIQCALRGYAARVFLKVKKDDRERHSAIREREALRLQSKWRGYVAQRRLKEFRIRQEGDIHAEEMQKAFIDFFGDLDDHGLKRERDRERDRLQKELKEAFVSFFGAF